MSKKYSAIVIAYLNRKGGVGKTTNVNILTNELVQNNNNKILLIDFDSQGSQTVLFKLNGDSYIGNSKHNIAKIFDREMVEPIKINSNLDFIPANIELIDKQESAILGKEKMLSIFIKKMKNKYDYIIVDTSPSFGSLMTNVVLASDKIVIPIGTSSLDEAGTHSFFKILEDIYEIYEKAINNIYILPSMYDKRRNDDKEVLSIIQNELPKYVNSLEAFKNTKLIVLDPIPFRTVFKDSAGSRMSVRSYIEQYEPTKKDVLLTIEKITKNILAD